MIHDLPGARSAYRKLLRLYPRAFREQLGEAMEQTFGDLCQERAQRNRTGMLAFLLGAFAETALAIFREHALVLAEGATMKSKGANLKPATLISFLLALPALFLFVVAALEPANGPVNSAFTVDGYQPTMLGRLAMIGIMVLPIMASVVILVPLVRNVRAGHSIAANPAGLAVAGVVSAFVVIFWLAVFVDQLPCLMGVPNCD